MNKYAQCIDQGTGRYITLNEFYVINSEYSGHNAEFFKITDNHLDESASFYKYKFIEVKLTNEQFNILTMGYARKAKQNETK